MMKVHDIANGRAWQDTLNQSQLLLCYRPKDQDHHQVQSETAVLERGVRLIRTRL